jgi:hypothetical protein
VSDRHALPGIRQAARTEKYLQLQRLLLSLKLASRLQVQLGMSVLRTMSLIAAAALVALGGSALALFL